MHADTARPPHALLTRVETWAHGSRVRSLVTRVGVTVVGPLLVLAGIAMTVLPGPGLVVAALGLGLLALEYEWARRALRLTGRWLSRARDTALPTDASPSRRLLGVAGAVAAVVATTALTAAVTTLLGSYAFL